MANSPPAKRRNVSVCAMPTMASQDDEDADRNEELNIDSTLLSQFERLPRELLWPIVEYVPESVFDMRLCSKTLQRQMDKYALRPENNLIQQFTLYSRPTLTNSLFMIAYPSVKNLFELRLKLLKNKYGLKFEVTRIASMTQYEIPWTDETETAPMVQLLQHCIGRVVKTVELFFCIERKSMNSISQLIERVCFTNLEICINTMTDEYARNITKIIENHGVDQLFLYFSKSTISNSSKFLIDVSNNIRSLIMYQKNHYGENSKMFGIYNPDGSMIVLDMFSRKLDKLCIRCVLYGGEVLPEDWTDILCERLPFLEKKVWLKSTHPVSSNIRNEIINEHIIHIGRDDPPVSRGVQVAYKTLTRQNYIFAIKHVSRENEISRSKS